VRPITTETQPGAMPETMGVLEAEIEEHLARYKGVVDKAGNRLVVRNGSQPERRILTGTGPIPVKRPRVDDRALAEAGKERFTSRILPPFMRRAASINTLVPVLYLKGISTEDFPTALEAILGPQAKGLSASTVVRLKEIWTEEYGEWSKRDLSGKRYAYV
jgi:putative transposase